MGCMYIVEGQIRLYHGNSKLIIFKLYLEIPDQILTTATKHGIELFISNIASCSPTRTKWIEAGISPQRDYESH